MKKRFAFIIVCTLVCIFIMCSNECDAEAKEKVVKEGKILSIDLDGDGKKEKIRYELIKDSYISYGDEYNYYSGMYLYINNKKAFSETWSQEYPPSKIVVKITDFNSSDAYKEILIDLDLATDDAHKFYAFRYNDKSLNVLFNSNRVSELSSKQEKGDKIKCGYTIQCALGCPVVFHDFNIVDQNLEPVKLKNQTLKTSTSHWAGKKYIYFASTDISMYSNTKNGIVIDKLKSGESFHITKIKMSNGKAKFAYVISNDTDKRGWIDIEGDGWSVVIVNNPANMI